MESDDKVFLEINDDIQKIQGVEVADPETYLELKSAVVNNAVHGWIPTKGDIESLLQVADKLDPRFLKIYRQINAK
ncbi:hypothetical protein FC52_GL001595 [Lactobacillus pasteurii DSM 23907 = CRBIP 24.76]|uniref:Uncharacterized protein n=1 Tax=Lactobacillus pasteurii DSM 23907 = CRBIP 24.76 TaxID=1423790 RepID=I7LDA1_9LACO|nr:hypothetical protein [Lactobacillus pasteurii]KRK07705.1 hypothetical protein FC52_GL001595 [Lactobacillus pasteurii DSM 23907 = CRBIP 24.76]TDG77714.1 hypothetical protein C5L33_000125 [Lactobacillus pasteurii]CCI84713.1 Putative uncharacterized protein [Lactobacillus pasteurii DSM 23907 = CRBIP 24.76]